MRPILLTTIVSLGFLFAASTSRADDVVHVKADAPVVIQTQTPDGWQPVCNGECNQTLPQNATYRVDGRGVSASAPFQLAAKPGSNVLVSVDTRPSGAFTAGVVLTTVGSILIAASVYFLVFGTIDTIGCAHVDCGVAGPIMPIFAAIGAGGTALGLGALIPGIVLMAHNAHSRVEQQPLPERTAMVPRTTGMSVPILSGRF